MIRFALTKVIFLLLVALYAPFRGRANCVPPTLSRLLVMQMAKLGDMVCTTPMFRALKEGYPNSEVSVMGNRTNEELLAGNKDVDQYHVFSGTFNAFRLLRSKQFDAAFIAGAPDATSLTLCYLAGVPIIVAPEVVGGHAPLADLWYRLLAKFVVTRPHRMGAYAPREYLRLLEPLAIRSLDTKKHLAYLEESKKSIDVYLHEHGLRDGSVLVGILPGAGNKVKEWPLDRFASVADALIEDGARVVLIGGSSDTEMGAQVRKLSKHSDSIVNTCGVFKLNESKALIASLNLLVGVDTGPLYIAEAFNIPTVDIVGPMDENEQPPRGEKHLVVVPPDARIPELHIMNAHPQDEREARRQTESISVTSVVEACRYLLRD